MTAEKVRHASGSEFVSLSGFNSDSDLDRDSDLNAHCTVSSNLSPASAVWIQVKVMVTVQSQHKCCGTV